MLDTNESRPIGAASEPCSDSSDLDRSRSAPPAESGEQWWPAPGFDSYEVSTLGRVWSRPRVIVDSRGHRYRLGGRILAPVYDRGGRRLVNLYRDRVMHQVRVRLLVLGAFVGPRPAGLECWHRNGDLDDCRLDNLTYGDHSQVMRGVVDNGHHANALRTHCPAGHRYDDENTDVWRRDGRISRHCRTCRRSRRRTNGGQP